jgi:23S rRNA (guanosine2251-2'-O)-methyltransferase
MTNEKNKNIIFGVNPVLERFRASTDDIQEVLISEAAGRNVLRAIKSEALQRGVRVVPIAPRFLDRLVGSRRHQGVVVRVKPFAHLDFDDLLPELSRAGATQRVLLLDGLTDPRNFGALLRTAEAVGIRHVVIPKDRAADVTPLVIKASSGAALHLRIAKVTNLRRAILALKAIGYWSAGLDPESTETIYDRSYPSRLAIVLGSEGRGIRPGILKECDFTASIPMLGKVASLNVAVAGAVFFYELLRQARAVDNEVPKSY